MSNNNIYDKLNLKKVINAAGKMSIIGVSTLSDEVSQAMVTAGQNYVVIEDFLRAADQYLADLLKVEDIHIVNSAAAGIALLTAGIVSKDNLLMQTNATLAVNAQNEIILPKGHSINFGGAVTTMINLGAGQVKEAGFANLCNKNDIIALINEKTAAIFYVKSHHSVQKSILSVEEAIAIAQEYQVPIFIDCAAEEDLTKYYHLGADVCIYSGSKALAGPTSGLLIGKKKYLDYVRKQSYGIGRAMKIGKENIAGLIVAIEQFLQKPNSANLQKTLLQHLQTKIMPLTGLHYEIVHDDSGREIYRGKITVNNDRYSANDLVQYLQHNNPIVVTRNNYLNQNIIYIDVRALNIDDINLISNYICEFHQQKTSKSQQRGA